MLLAVRILSYGGTWNRKNNTPNATAISNMKMARSTMTINTKFNVPVETFCGEYSPTAVSNVVPEQEKKNIYFFFRSGFSSVF